MWTARRLSQAHQTDSVVAAVAAAAAAAAAAKAVAFEETENASPTTVRTSAELVLVEHYFHRLCAARDKSFPH
jgi:hypothetical protein